MRTHTRIHTHTHSHTPCRSRGHRSAKSPHGERRCPASSRGVCGHVCSAAITSSKPPPSKGLGFCINAKQQAPSYLACVTLSTPGPPIPTARLLTTEASLPLPRDRGPAQAAGGNTATPTPTCMPPPPLPALRVYFCSNRFQQPSNSTWLSICTSIAFSGVSCDCGRNRRMKSRQSAATTSNPWPSDHKQSSGQGLQQAIGTVLHKKDTADCLPRAGPPSPLPLSAQLGLPKCWNPCCADGTVAVAQTERMQAG